jgi:hypothetical protein
LFVINTTNTSAPTIQHIHKLLGISLDYAPITQIVKGTVSRDLGL